MSRLVKRLHAHHLQRRKHVLIGHAMELAGGMFSLLKLELIAQGMIMGGVAILIVGLLLIEE